MKPLFGFNKTTNSAGYAHKFIIKEISKSLETEYDEIATISYNINKKLQNKMKKYAKYVIFFGAILFFIAMGSALVHGWDVLFNEQKYSFILGIIGIVVGLIMQIVSLFIKPRKAVLEDLEWNKRELARWIKKRNEYFGFDNNYEEIDILCPQYAIKDGVVKLEVPMGIFNNIPTVMYKKDNNLYISDNLSLYEIPLENFVKIETVNGKKGFLNWTQKEEFTKEYQQENNIFKGSTGYRAYSYKKVIFNFEGEEYYFEVLPYDFEVLSKIFEEEKEVTSELEETTKKLD